uniref:Uncharacterized protein n=1 Tax=Leersia perrieri TaxID=77586 RepID=A0A0D9W3X3_9ORYZ
MGGDVWQQRLNEYRTTPHQPGGHPIGAQLLLSSLYVLGALLTFLTSISQLQWILDAIISLQNEGLSGKAATGALSRVVELCNDLLTMTSVTDEPPMLLHTVAMVLSRKE